MLMTLVVFLSWDHFVPAVAIKALNVVSRLYFNINLQVSHGTAKKSEPLFSGVLWSWHALFFCFIFFHSIISFKWELSIWQNSHGSISIQPKGLLQSAWMNSQWIHSYNLNSKCYIWRWQKHGNLYLSRSTDAYIKKSWRTDSTSLLK